MLLPLHPFQLFIKRRSIAVMLMVSLLVNLFMWIWITLNIRPTSEPVFLGYNILFGVNLIGDWWKLYALPLLGGSILIINMLAGWVLYKIDTFFAHILLATAVLVQMTLAASLWVLVFLNV